MLGVRGSCKSPSLCRSQWSPRPRSGSATCNANCPRCALRCLGIRHSSTLSEWPPEKKLEDEAVVLVFCALPVIAIQTTHLQCACFLVCDVSLHLLQVAASACLEPLGHASYNFLVRGEWPKKNRNGFGKRYSRMSRASRLQAGARGPQRCQVHARMVS